MDSYQAIYDAVRSRISGGNVGEIVAEAARQAFDISMMVPIVRDELCMTAYEQRRPFVLLRPKMYPDGDQWCALYGDDLQAGVAGFGETPEKAAVAFDLAWMNSRANAELCGGESVRTSAGLVAWLPIETAPQDNKARLVYCPDNECMFCVSFDKMDGSWIYFGGGGTLFHVPTHWMPLPEAPNATDKGSA